MVFKVFKERRRKFEGKIVYEYFIRGEGSWSFEDIVPYMKKISDRSPFYKLQSRRINYLKDKEYFADIFVQGTLDSKTNRLVIVDKGIGAQMIRKYVRALEKEV